MCGSRNDNGSFDLKVKRARGIEKERERAGGRGEINKSKCDKMNAFFTILHSVDKSEICSLDQYRMAFYGRDVTQPILFNSWFSFVRQTPNGRNQTYLMIFFSPPYTHALDVTCHDRMMLMIQLIKDIIEFGIQIANDIEFNVREKTDTK